jgi:hypothetical protein
MSSGESAKARGPLPQPLPSEIDCEAVRIGPVAETYYSRRSARDPEWRAAQLEGAKERERRRRESDPEGVRAANREKTRRTRARQAAHGLTFHELRERCLIRGYPDAEGTLRRVLRDEIHRGRIEYHSTTRRFVMNGGLDPETRRALLDL